MSISAIVPVWNGRELLARLLATLGGADRARRRDAGGGQRLAPMARRSWPGRAARA